MTRSKSPPAKPNRNPYQPTCLDDGESSSHAAGMVPRWPVPAMILGSSFVIGITVAMTMTTDLGPRPGEFNLALAAFVALSLTFGAAGALFGYQYLLGIVPLWYSSVALGVFAVLPIYRYPNIDRMLILGSVLATANAVVATIVPWVARHWFGAAVERR